LKIEIIETNRFQTGVKLPDLEGLATCAKAAETGSFARPRRAEASRLALRYQPRNWAIAKKAIKGGSRPAFAERFTTVDLGSLHVHSPIDVLFSGLPRAAGSSACSTISGGARLTGRGVELTGGLPVAVKPII
jgi:hypothetical protein